MNKYYIFGMILAVLGLILIVIDAVDYLFLDNNLPSSIGLIGILIAIIGLFIQKFL